MLKINNLLDNVLKEIESRLREDINVDALSKKFGLSTTHLRFIFKNAFKQSIGSYIRSRKLALSVEDLLHTDLNILDVTLDYGFEHEQSYIRTFKREFGLTLGEFRSTGEYIKIKPPLNLFEAREINDGVLFGPDIVMVPHFHVVGKKYKVSFRDGLYLSSKLSYDFNTNERFNVPNKTNPYVYFNFSTAEENSRETSDYFYHMPAVQVNSFKNVPEYLDTNTFPSTLCARFCFIGPKSSEINTSAADMLFDLIDKFMDDENQKYFLERKRINFERLDLSAYNGNFCKYEWYAPVIKKTINEIQSFL